MTVMKKVPPDGGWGWAIVIGAIILNMTGRSLEPSFGLLFGDLLKILQIETTGAAIILSTMDAVINFSGLFVGPLIKRFTYRKVAIAGSLLSALGLCITSMATSMAHIIITYSIMGGLGIGLMISCSFIGLNLYFDKKKGQSVGLAMAGTAFGYMAMPQIVSFLILRFNFQESILILTAICANSIVGAALFQPVKWHLIEVNLPTIKEDIIEIPEEKIPNQQIDENIEQAASLLLKLDPNNIQRKSSVPIGPNRKVSIVSASFPKVKSLSDCTQHGLTTTTTTTPMTSNKNLSHVSSSTAIRKSSMTSNISNMDFVGSSMHIAYETDDDRGLEFSADKKNSLDVNKKTSIDDVHQQSCWTSFLKIMGFDLLSDLIYWNILFGIALIFVGDLQFRMIMPFYMLNMDYTKQQVATVLSSMAIADILSRLVMPMIFDRLPFTRRSTLMTCCILMGISRSALAIQEDMVSFIIVAVINGFIRGMTLINIPLVLSEYATKDNFPSVLGLSMVFRGIFIVLFGPIGGYIRDYTKSYPLCIHVQSLMFFLCSLAWLLEYSVKKKICRKSA